MGRGLSQRRRLKNFNTARQAKSRTIPLPPPPEEVERKRKKQRTDSGASYEGPASFRKMMQVKEAVERRQIGSHKTLQENLTAEQRKSKPLRIGRDETEEAKFSSQEAAKEEGPKTSRRKKKEAAFEPGSQEASLTATLYPKKPLKPRKKEFLKMKKLKKKGKAKATAGQKAGGDNDEVDSDPEELVDAHKPAFGEQAMQPLKVNLKRKHWAHSTSGGGKNHLLEVFERQMQDAEAKQ